MVGHENETLGARARRMYRQRRAWLMETGDHIYAGATEPPRLVTAWRVAVVVLLVADVLERVLSYVELRGIRALLELPR